MFHICERAAYLRLSASGVFTEPVVISSDSINDNNPVKLIGAVSHYEDRKTAADSNTGYAHIVATLQAGFQDPGWKSDMEKQIFLSG